MKTIPDLELERLTRGAQDSPRRRMHLNVHTDLDDPIQRLVVAFEPGTYIQPHRHPEAGKWEMFILLTGAAAVLLFDDFAQVTRRVELAERDAHRLMEIPPQQWHTLVCLRDSSVLFECKPGPYQPLDDRDFAAWAPKEKTAQVAEFVAWLERAQPGERAPILKP